MEVGNGSTTNHQTMLGRQLGILQFNSVLTLYLEIISDFTGQGLSPKRLLLLTFRYQSQVQVVTCASDKSDIDWRFQ